jgi:MFS family permease
VATQAKTGTLETNIPARLDRLPWSRFHWLIILGLGTVWVLDGLEVTIVGSIAGRLTEDGSGIDISASQIGTAGAIYVIGACLGALFFGQLTDRFGRKKLFMLTLVLYLAATAATAFSFAPWFFFLCRFFTGAGIGGEYAAINSAIDELIPARVRGRVDLTINGSFWVGSVIASALAMLFLDPNIFPKNLGWRLEFGVGVVLAFGILLVRRHVPESPRWLFIHGQEEEAERIVDGIERDVEEETGQPLDTPDKTIEVRQRETIPFREIAKVAFKLYPRRAILGFALFVGQAFIYNGVTFNLGTLFTTFFGVAAGVVPVFIIIYGVGNFLGPLTLGRLFDTVGRKPMIAGCYLGSALLTVPMGILFQQDLIGEWAFEAFVFFTFFLASAGASAAYLTVSEIFPMETRALAIAFFYAIGTAAGGIAGPLLFGHLIESGDRTNVMIAFFIGAGVMAIGGIAELFLGVRSEQAQLEDIAQPLTVEDAEQEGDGDGDEQQATRDEAHECRARAEQSRATAAEHRAVVHELRARAAEGDERAADRAEIEARLAEIAELRASADDERAAAHDEGDDDAGRERARAAEQRAAGYEERAQALGAADEDEARRHQFLAEAAGERARAREQHAAAEQARADTEGADEAREARADMHEHWAAMHDARAHERECRAEGDDDGAEGRDREAARHSELALAAEQRVQAAEHRVSADEAADASEDAEDRRAEAERQRRQHEFEERVRTRIARRQAHERHGLRRFRPGPPERAVPAWMASSPQAADDDLDQEIEVIGRALDEHGPTERRELSRIVGSRYWGPGRFRAALREAVADGRARRLSRSTYGPPQHDDEDRS